jgi:hypothetical protein
VPVNIWYHRDMMAASAVSDSDRCAQIRDGDPGSTGTS